MLAKTHHHRRSARRCAGFAMAESLMAIAIASVAATAMLTSVAAAIQSSTNSINDALGQGLAQQLMDEVASVDFPSGTNTPLGAGTVRSAFRDIDDFASYSASPPVDRNGFPIGTEGPGSQAPTTRAIWMQPDLNFFSGITQQVLVERLQPNGTGWTVVTQNTGYRRVTVTISSTAGNTPSRMLAQNVRVFAYAPPGP